MVLSEQLGGVIFALIKLHHVHEGDNCHDFILLPFVQALWRSGDSVQHQLMLFRLFFLHVLLWGDGAHRASWCCANSWCCARHMHCLHWNPAAFEWPGKKLAKKKSPIARMSVSHKERKWQTFLWVRPIVLEASGCYLALSVWVTS